ncbi:hypothetical protein ASD23_12380 [Agromyces sp. Root1464]|jgi:hypothetical protein|uniref:hypothetical protein n=1 Tax=Agromyces sp. Root1464 TaxID=1736467 RepID=UPI0006F9AFA5|nr:hypothetical protein [Agromyces sp. Root1464]KQZ09093.1 hypothetical protein ASD23_12380 [Agromyces sp. Root1464]
MEQLERPLATLTGELRRVRSRGLMITAAAFIVAGLLGLVVSLTQYDAIVAMSSDYEGRRSALRGLVAPALVLFSAAALIGGIVWLTAWSYRWERVATGSRVKQSVNAYAHVAPQDAAALLERFRTGDPRVYLPVPAAKSGQVTFGIWLAPRDSVAYVTVVARSGNGWQPLPPVVLRENAYAAISQVTVDNYGARASQTIVNGFLDPFLRG